MSNADVLLQVIQRLNSNPYSLTKQECISEVQKMRDAALSAPREASKPELKAAYTQGYNDAAVEFGPKEASKAVPVADEQIDAVFHKYAGSNDNGTPWLRAYENNFRIIAREVLALHPSQPEPTSKGATDYFALQKIAEQYGIDYNRFCAAFLEAHHHPSHFPASQQRALSDEEIRQVWYDCGVGTELDIPPCEDNMRFARAILAASSGSKGGGE